MPIVKRILRHVQVEVAARARICHHDRAKHAISKGEKCLTVKEGEPAKGRNYCPICAKEILDLAEKDLVGVRKELFGATSGE